MASLKTYDITLEDNTVLRLRLTSRALSNYIKAHGIDGAAPVVSVLNAVNSIDAQIALFTAALKCDSKNAIQDGAVLIDRLNDEDRGDAYRRGLITYLAAGAGLITLDKLSEVLEATVQDGEELLSKVLSFLRHEPFQSEASASAEENPT